MKRTFLFAMLVAGISITSCETSQSSTGTSADSTMMNQTDTSALSTGTDTSSTMGTMGSGADTSKMRDTSGMRTRDTSTMRRDSIPQ